MATTPTHRPTSETIRASRPDRRRGLSGLHHPLSVGLMAGIAILLASSGAQCWLFQPWLPWNPAPPRTAGIQPFESPEQLRAYLADQAAQRIRQARGWGGFGMFDSGIVPLSGASSDAAQSPEAGDTTPYSTTNIQEPGVDEADIVKNDGTHIYWLKGRRIHVVAATPPDELDEVATITLDNPADALYLSGHQLIALSYGYGPGYSHGGIPIGGGGEADEGDTTESSPGDTGDATAVDAAIAMPGFVESPWFDGNRTRVTFIDVTDPASPTVQATVDMEGHLVTSRLIGNRLHVVLTTYPRLPANPTPLAIQAMSLEDWLPDFEIATDDGTVQSGDLVRWQHAYRPVSADGYAITAVVTLRTDDPTAPFESTAITADAGVIYASPNALYVCDPEYDWTLGSSRTNTIVHKLTFTETGTHYAASGLVPGRPLNQYSLGEYQGYLRIATTQRTFTGEGMQTTNGVYVLDEVDGELTVVGQIEELGIGETIYAARFLGERGFLVTFRRIDPLFTMDLSDPANPRLVGELKVPGYSDHIQFLDENHLLTIGKDAQEAGDWGAWVQGVQLSIFDVSDLANPILLHKEIIGTRGTHSEANNDPKAFNYYPAADALALPIELYEGDTSGPEYGTHTFTGLLVYHVSLDAGFTELGRISTVPDDEELGDNCWWDYYGPTRGVFIGDAVYAVSNLGVVSARLGDDELIPLDEVPFEDTPQQYCGWIEPAILPAIDGGLR